jgi:hypothetical protein
MKRDHEAYKESIRALVGEIYWETPPAMYLFQREYMSRDGALLFALEHCQFTDKFPRWFGNIIANCPFIEARAYMIENMFVEEVKDPTIDVGHNESMWAFAKALGASEQEIRDYVPLIVTTMALAYFDNASRTKPWLEALRGTGKSPEIRPSRGRNSDSRKRRCRTGPPPNMPITVPVTTAPDMARMHSSCWRASR